MGGTIIAGTVVCAVALLLLGFGLWFGGRWVFSKFSSERSGNSVQQPIAPPPAGASPAPDGQSPTRPGTTPAEDSH